MAERPRGLQWPVASAFLTVTGAVTLGVDTVNVGHGGAPNCPAPYGIVKIVNEIVDGDMESPESDSQVRIQVIAVGDTAEVAMKLNDKFRAVITRSTIDADLLTQTSGRKCIELKLDLGRAPMREERGLPNPLFSEVDQYLVKTTPR